MGQCYAALSFLLASIIFTNPVYATVPEYQRSALKSTHYVQDELIIKYRKNRVNLRESAGKRASDSFDKGNHLEFRDEIKDLNVRVLKIKDGKSVAEKIAELSGDPNVEYVEPNYKKSDSGIATNDPDRGKLWGLDNVGQNLNGTSGIDDADIDAPEAWTVNEGTNANIIVAVIDSGVDYTHPDLAANMWEGSSCKDENGSFLGGCVHGYDYYLGGSDVDPMPTDNDHGTHIAGTIAAAKNNGVGIVGVAPNAKIMAVKFDLYVSSEIKALAFAAQNGAKIVNASYSGEDYSQAEYDAINLFRSSGGIFIAAAGNGGGDELGDDNDVTPAYPASYELDNIISVAATTQTDGLANFSNYGSISVDIGAPGYNIYSTTYPGGGYGYKAGTSMAAPHVTGLAALLWGYRDNYSYADVVNIVISSGDSISPLSNKTTTGKRINAYGALTSIPPVGALDHIDIFPNTTQTITVGQTKQFTASGQDQYHNDITGLTYTWSGADSNGLFTGTTAGTFQVKVSSGGIDSVSVTVNVSPIIQNPPIPVYQNVHRFWNTNGTHFYTASESEKNNVIARWSDKFKYEGVAYSVNLNSQKNLVPLYRLWNANGTHFYTASYQEAIGAATKWPTRFKLEGVAYYVTTDPAGTTPVHRFWNTNGTHFYTASESEKNNVIAKWSDKFKYEGVAYYLPN